jgi:hypothetical protein
LNLFSFNKFLQIYIKVNAAWNQILKIIIVITEKIIQDEWERMSTVIEKPFLLKSNFDDIQESLSIFKLVWNDDLIFYLFTNVFII